MTRMGVRVVVTPEDAQPVEVTHATLPAPTLTPAPTPLAEAERTKPSLVARPASKTEARCAAAAAAVKLLSPLDRAKAARRRSSRKRRPRPRPQGGRRGLRRKGRRGQQGHRGPARCRAGARGGARRARGRGQGRRPGQVARGKRKGQGGGVGRRSQGRGSARRPRRRPPQSKPPRARRRCGGEGGLGRGEGERRGNRVVRAGERTIEPISIFISRKTSRVYIRQAWGPSTRLPSPSRSPTPLGTHVYVAMEPHDDGKAMRWLTVTSRRHAGRDAKSPGTPQATSAGAITRSPRSQPGRPHETAAERARAHRAAGGDAAVHCRQALGRSLADRLRPGHQPRNGKIYRFHRSEPVSGAAERETSGACAPPPRQASEPRL